MITHVLKCWPQPFADLLSGVKTHEFRLNDRDYQAGDMLKLRCFDPTTDSYTGAELQRQVSHVLRDGFGLPAGYAVLSLSACLIDDLPQEFSLNLETLEVMAETAAAAGDIASDEAPADHPRKPFSIAELTQEQDEFISLVDPASALQLIALARKQLITPATTQCPQDERAAFEAAHRGMQFEAVSDKDGGYYTWRLTQAKWEAWQARSRFSAGTVPTGWKLVPIEPTETMIVFGFESTPDEFFSPEEEWEQYQAMSGCAQAGYRARLCWDAMLQHAPEPPSHDVTMASRQKEGGAA